MNVTPLKNYIVVRPIVEEFSTGGIFVGKQVDRKLVKDAVRSEIVAVGPGGYDKKGRRESMWGLKPGDIVYHSAAGNTRIDGGLVIIKRDAVVFLDEAQEAA